MDRHDEDLCRRIENGIRDYRAKGRIRISAPFSSTLDREALHQTARTSETPEPIRRRKHRLKDMSNIGGLPNYTPAQSRVSRSRGCRREPNETSFCAAIRIAKEQKSVSLEKRAEATYAEYLRQKASGSGGRGFRLPL